MPCLQLIFCFIVQFVVRLSENVLKNCVIILVTVNEVEMHI